MISEMESILELLLKNGWCLEDTEIPVPSGKNGFQEHWRLRKGGETRHLCIVQLLEKTGGLSKGWWLLGSPQKPEAYANTTKGNHLKIQANWRKEWPRFVQYLEASQNVVIEDNS